jgi:formate hydrogenlyase transcriptional activator
MIPAMASAGQPEPLNIQLLVDSIPALIHTARPDGYLDYFNKPWLEYVGVTLDKVAGWNWTAYIHPEDVEGIVSRWRACLVTGEIFEYETRVLSATGEYRWMFHRKVPLRDANGNIVKWYGSSLDIEDRKQAEVLLSVEKQFLEMTATDVTLERILNVLCLFIEEHRSGTLASVLLLSPDGVYLRFAAGPSIPNEWKQQMEKLPIGPCAGSCGTAAYTRSPVIVSDIATDPLWEVPEHRASALKHGLRASWSSPVLSSKGKVLGTFCMYYREPRSPEAQDLELIKSATHLVGVAIERDRAEQALGRTEAYLTEAQKLSHTGSFGWRPDTGEIVWSDETYRIFEYDPAEKPTLNLVLQRIHPQDRAVAQQLIEDVSKSGADFEQECRLVVPSGATKHLHVRAHALRDSSGNIEFVGAVSDITERKTTEEDLRSSEGYLAEAQKMSQTGSWAWSAAIGGPSYWSEECYRVLGFDPADGLPQGEDFFQRIHPDDRPGFRELAETSIREKAEWQADYRIVHPDGRVRDIHVIAHPVLSASGELVEFVGTVIDVTERKRAEEALRSSEAYLAEAQRLSQTGSWAWSPEQDIRYWSEECYRVLSFDPQDGLPRFEEFFQRIHPDDQPSFRELIQTAIREKAEWQADYRIVHPDRPVKDVHVVGHPVLSPSGHLVEFVGTVIDVTERKRAEEELRRSEVELRQIVDLVPQLIAVYGPNRERLYANRTALDYLGISLDEWRHKPFAASAHPDDSERLKTYTDRALSTGAADELELRLRKRDGSYRWFLAHFKPLLDENGQIIRWYYTGTDIDDRKRAEDRLREENVALKRAEEKIRGQEAELRQMLDLAPQLVAVFGPDHERIYANRMGLDYLGITLEEWRQTGDMRRFVHPDDGDRMRAFFERALSIGTAYQLEFRIRKGDGSYRWFLARYNPLRDELGRAARWYVALTDIEDRKQAEDTLRRENVALREEIDKASMFEEIVGTSPALQAVLSRISKVAPSDSTVLITGETGTGKELVARAIHRRSSRASRAFVSVNCAAIPRELIGSELFGHEKGAFTGASQQRLGRFELASGGTLFLDEVGELPHETQIALLRVLQEHEFERVGGTRPIRADVRVIAATNRELQAAIGAGFFRRDLFYRLNVFPIEIPSLRERKEDIRLLVEYFIDRYARKAGKNITSVDKKTLRLLESYPWPGNIRELQNVIERSVIVSETASFSVDESWLSQQPPERKAEGELYLSEKVAAQEKEIIEAALRECQGRVFGPKGAAAKLGIPRSTLESKIRALKINKNRFKASAG